MSVNENSDPGAPIAPGSPLARALDGYRPPRLSVDFADRVLAAAEARPPTTLPPLPELRRPSRGWRGWRTGRRVAIGIASFGALATAAAATGLLQRLDLPVPSARTVWASITGTAAATPEVLRTPAPALAAADPAAVAIVGPIDTPEELGEAFRRIDAVRAGRREERRALIDQRIDAEIARRRAAGLPVPTPEEEARLRERIDAALSSRQQAIDTRVRQRREELQRKIESGEALTREDVIRPSRQDTQASQQVERIRQMPQGKRREALRNLSPDERRALIEELRARRAAAPGSELPPAPQLAEDAPTSDTP